jgi:phenylacetate-CoA ligase
MADEMPCPDPVRDESVGRMRAVRFIWVALDARYAEWRGPAAIERRQRARLARLVRHARSASPFYRRLYRGLPSGVTDPSRLPPVRKRDLMEHFDEWVTDPDITLESLRRDYLSDPSLVGSPYLGRYTASRRLGQRGSRPC